MNESGKIKYCAKAEDEMFCVLYCNVNHAVHITYTDT